MTTRAIRERAIAGYRGVFDRVQHVWRRRLGRSPALCPPSEEDSEDRGRPAQRYELLQNPTASLWHIRKKWAFEQRLSGAEWDALAQFVAIGIDEEALRPPNGYAAIPGHESYLGVLDAFEAVYCYRREQASRYCWSYFARIGGRRLALFELDAKQRDRALLNQVSALRERLWRDGVDDTIPSSIGNCFCTAVQQEGVAGSTLSYILVPYWPVLWRLAARGHWLRYQAPILGAEAHAFRTTPRWQRPQFPGRLMDGDFAMAVTPMDNGAFALHIDFGPERRLLCTFCNYPLIAELRTMLRESLCEYRDGRYFQAVRYRLPDVQDFLFMEKEKVAYGQGLLVKRDGVELSFSAEEWETLRNLFERTWAQPELQLRIRELELQYGEHGT